MPIMQRSKIRSASRREAWPIASPTLPRQPLTSRTIASWPMNMHDDHSSSDQHPRARLAAARPGGTRGSTMRDNHRGQKDHPSATGTISRRLAAAAPWLRPRPVRNRIAHRRSPLVRSPTLCGGAATLAIALAAGAQLRAMSRCDERRRHRMAGQRRAGPLSRSAGRDGGARRRRSRRARRASCVWLLEHPPLFTAGTSADPAELFNPRGFPVFEAGRGGRYTYHGPGPAGRLSDARPRKARPRHPPFRPFARRLDDRRARPSSASKRGASRAASASGPATAQTRRRSARSASA